MHKAGVRRDQFTMLIFLLCTAFDFSFVYSFYTVDAM